MVNQDSRVAFATASSDPDVFADWVSRHGVAIHGYLCRRVGRQVADELLGEVWLQSFKSRNSFNHDQYSNPLPWLYGVARNVLRSHWRAAGRASSYFEAAITDPWPEVDTQLDAITQRPGLEVALTMLSDDEREVLLLVAWEHLSPAEISRLLNLPQGTVRSRLHRARTIMRAQLAVATNETDTTFSEEY